MKLDARLESIRSSLKTLHSSPEPVYPESVCPESDHPELSADHVLKGKYLIQALPNSEGDRRSYEGNGNWEKMSEHSAIHFAVPPITRFRHEVTSCLRSKIRDNKIPEMCATHSIMPCKISLKKESLVTNQNLSLYNRIAL